MFALCHLVNIAVASVFVPANIFEMVYSLQGHCNSFQTIGQFNCRDFESQTARLLKIGELSNFLTVQPDLPTQTPGG